jgi:hypothetical protein
MLRSERIERPSEAVWVVKLTGGADDAQQKRPDSSLLPVGEAGVEVAEEYI